MARFIWTISVLKQVFDADSLWVHFNGCPTNAGMTRYGVSSKTRGKFSAFPVLSCSSTKYMSPSCVTGIVTEKLPSGSLVMPVLCQVDSLGTGLNHSTSFAIPFRAEARQEIVA